MSLVLCFCGYMVKCIKIMVKEFYRLFSEIGGSDIHDKYTFLPQVVFAENDSKKHHHDVARS